MANPMGLPGAGSAMDAATVAALTTGDREAQRLGAQLGPSATPEQALNALWDGPVGQDFDAPNPHSVAAMKQAIAGLPVLGSTNVNKLFIDNYPHEWSLPGKVIGAWGLLGQGAAAKQQMEKNRLRAYQTKQLMGW
jgi:hypothetical protein